MFKHVGVWDAKNLRAPTQNDRRTESERFVPLARKAKQAIRGWSMEPDAVQRENKPLECRLILRRCS